MINFFQIAPQDQSLYYLGTIFGLVGDLLPVQQAPLLLSIMFKFINTVALSIGAALVIYVTVVGLLKTAAEGEFLGRQWNSLWVPIRTVLGIAALFPTATGYSAIQVIIMWIVLQGIGAADTLWNTVLNYKAVVGNPAATVMIPAPTISDTMQNLFKGLVCQASAKTANPDVGLSSTEGTVHYYCAASAHSGEPFCQSTRTRDAMLNVLTGPQAGNNRYSMGPGANGGTGGLCGTLTYCDKNEACQDSTSLSCAACTAQQTTLAAIVPVLGDIAQNLVNADYAYLQFRERYAAPSAWITAYCNANNTSADRCCARVVYLYDPFTNIPTIAPAAMQVCNYSIFSNFATWREHDLNNVNENTAKDLYFNNALKDFLSSSNTNFINTITGEYITSITGAVADQLARNMASRPASSDDQWIQDAKNTGWILAGAYYYKVTEISKSNVDLTNPAFSAVSTNPSENAVGGYRNNVLATSDLLSAIEAEGAKTATYSAPPEFHGISNKLGVLSGSLVNTFIANLSTGGTRDTHVTENPLVKIADFGYGLMILAQALFWIIVAVVIALTATGTINPMFMGTGLTMSPMGEAIKAAIGLFTPFIALLVGSLYSLGALLGIYIPLIPFVIFTVGAIGWLVAVIEAMVAAPIVALGILSPGGHHDILGRAEPALMMIFNLFLRPLLMVFGLMAALLLSIAVVNLVNAGFLYVIRQIQTAPGLFEQILFIAAYVSLLVTALNKTFSLIYAIPERVLTWIGGPAVQYGEGEALGAAKHGIEGAAGAGVGAAKGGAAGAGGQMLQTSAQSRQEKMQKERDEKQGGGPGVAPK
ncbi:MAG: Defect in organelle trafficking protein [uncultured bacterium]|nr:MAG: Defect in organelle trafficking protein [uncultured bacterium]